jgi:acyl carrier protein
MDQKFDEIRKIVADVLEVEPEEVAEDADFRDQFEADSIRAIEILSRLEKKYGIEIPQSDLPRMQNLKAVYDVVTHHAGWEE